MKYGKKSSGEAHRCLECGTSINYGRSDKKYCCDKCRDRHNNNNSKSARAVKRRILSILERNYEVLDELVKAGVEAVWLPDLLTMGFNPYFATSFNRRHSKDEYSCFDIHYVITPNRVSSISKLRNLSLTLQAGSEKPAHKHEIDKE